MDENNLNESEISPKKIFELMKANIYDNYYNYSFSSLNKDYLSSRKAIFNTLHKITIRMGFKSQTFFLSAHYLDIIFTKKRRINSSLNTLGLACLVLSAKFCENDPIVPHLQYFIRIYNNIMGYKNVISMSDLKRNEVLVLKLLNYKLNYYTIYDFDSFLFGHGILKIEQLKDIQNPNKRLYRSKRKEFTINPTNSLLIKNILEKIYKKSRYYLDDIIHNTKLCFKYNPLYISIYIMKKSIEEILCSEQKINDLNEKDQEEFYSKTNSCFKQIMFDFYKIDYETNEQYREILADEEIMEIFEGKGINLEAPAPLPDKKFKKNQNQIQKEEKNINLKNNKEEIDLNSNLNINNEIENKSSFTGSYTNGFYNRLKIRTNFDNLNKRNIERHEKERTLFSSRKENTNINNNFEYDDNKGDEDDDLDSNLNINELQNTKWNDIKANKAKSIFGGTSTYSKKESQEGLSSSNKYTNLLKNKYIISSNNRYMQRTDTYNSINSINSTTTIKKNNFNKNYDLTYSVNSYRGGKIGLNKSIEPKTEKSSPHKFDATNVRSGYSNFTKFNQYIKLKELNNTGNNRNDYSYNLNINNSNNNNNNFNYNTIKKYEKKPYYKKLIYTNTNDNSNLNSINRNGVSSYFYSNNFNSEVDRNKNNEYNFNNINSSNRNKIDINNKEIVSSKINTFYSRIRVKSKNTENNIINNNEDEKRYENNDLNKKQEITTTSSRFRRRPYQNNIINNNDISAEIKDANPLITKDKKKEIESYSHSNSRQANYNIFTKISANTIFKRKNKILNIFPNNENSINSNEIKADNKGLTSHNFYRNSNVNKITVNTVNTTRENENRNNEINKGYEPSKRISYVISKKNSDLNNTLKEINKAHANNMEKEITVNTINNDKTKKIYQSIRHRYLNLKKKENNNNNPDNNTINNESSNISNNNIIKSKTISDFSKTENKSLNNINLNNKLNINTNNTNNSNYNLSSIKAVSFRGKKIINKNEDNINNINNNNNTNPLTNRIAELESKNKYKESSLYRIINKTKNLFSRANKEEEQNKKLENNDKANVNNESNSNNNQNLNVNFYKSQQNFYKPSLRQNENNTNTKINVEKEEKGKDKQNSKLNNTAYLKSIINKNKNKISKDNKDNPISNNNTNSQNQKNSSTIVINNNININIGNKTNNINNEYVKYKNVYKKNNMPELNLNNNVLNSNNLNSNTNITERRNNNIGNNGSTFSSLINRFHFYRKNTDKNNNNNINTTNSNSSNHAEKNIFSFRK